MFSHPWTTLKADLQRRAASLGFSVTKPWGESDRYDFMVDCGTRIWRVQVKSAHSSALNGYSFHACGNPFDSFPLRGQSLRAGSARSTCRGEIDFIVGYVVSDDVWYVIPIEAYGERTTIKVFPSSRRRMSRFEKYRDAWHYFGEPGTATLSTEAK